MATLILNVSSHINILLCTVIQHFGLTLSDISINLYVKPISMKSTKVTMYTSFVTNYKCPSTLILIISSSTLTYRKHGTVRWAKTFMVFKSTTKDFVNIYLCIYVYELRIFKYFKYKAPQKFPHESFIGLNLWKFSPANLSIFTEYSTLRYMHSLFLSALLCPRNVFYRTRSLRVWYRMFDLLLHKVLPVLL